MAVKLHRCSGQFLKIKAHPCWRVEKALQDAAIDYERVPGPMGRGKRTVLREGTGQSLYPAIQFEDGSWYREESKEMERTIREGRLLERAAPSAAGAWAPAEPSVGAVEPEAGLPAEEPPAVEPATEEPTVEEPRAESGGTEPEVH